MQNGFEKHKLKHVSPSQINMYASCAGAWCARYLFGYKFSFSNAARAGVLAEDAVQAVLSGAMDRDDAVKQALDTYNAAIVLTGTDADKRRGEAIEGMIDNALDVLQEYGKPCFENVSDFNGQKEIVLMCNGDGWKMPVKGYLDFVYPQHNFVIDLKTTMKCPSVMSNEHLIQGAIYKKATGMDIKFLYCTGKKSVLFEIDDDTMNIKLAEVKNTLNRLEKFLRLDAHLIKDIVPVNKGSYYWTDDGHIINDLYGI